MISPSIQIREDLLRHHGNFALAYSAAWQPGLDYFGDERGVLAYRTVRGSALVLSNPLAPRNRWRDLIGDFANEKGDTSFWQVSREVADVLSDLEFRVNEMGTESRIDVESYDFRGPRKRNFRTAANRMSAQGLHTREAAAGEVDTGALAGISEEWRQTRTVKSRELTFLVRPVVFEDEPDVRKFYTFAPDGRPVAFAVFDPVYEDGALVGYLMATKRKLPDADPLVGYDLVRHAIETFRSEGLKWLMLGLAPADRVKDKEFNADWTMSQTFHFVRNSGPFNRWVYPVQGLNRHKASFLGTRHATYCAFNRWPGVVRFARMGRACGIV